MRKSLFTSQIDFEGRNKTDPKQLSACVKASMESLDPLARRVLIFVLQHMKRMSEIKGNLSYNSFVIYLLSLRYCGLVVFVKGIVIAKVDVFL